MVQTAWHHMEFLHYHHVDQTTHTHTASRIYSDCMQSSALTRNTLNNARISRHACVYMCYCASYCITLQCGSM